MTKEDTKFDKSRRMNERIHLTLPSRVQGRDGPGQEWSEMTRLLDVSPFGARFRISHPIEVGRLLLLITAMPRPLRVYDFAENQYRVWALVRNLKLLDPNEAKGALMEVGVAFIGRRPPPSYEQDPTKRYEAAESKLDELTSREDAADQLAEVVRRDQRSESRQLIPIAVLIEIIEDGKVTKSESTVTENISRKGAAVFTSFELAPGTFLKISNEGQGTPVLAVVRATRKGVEGLTRLHLEFISGEWPL